MIEIRRIEDWGHRGETNCVICGARIYLWFNGGELDQKQCCGLTYQQEARGYDLVIYRDDEASPPPREPKE
jgi:hypothetical protein